MEYRYDSLNRLVAISSSSNIIGERNKVLEIHEWFYDNQGVPDKMIRIKDKSDSSHYQFKKDENNRIIEEQQIRNGVGGEKTYYYYDQQGRLSDIVRYNERAGKLLPDYLFNYDEDENSGKW